MNENRDDDLTKDEWLATVPLRVEHGAMLLDLLAPGWAARIAADSLVMESCDRCVLGQLYGNYATGFREVCRASREESPVPLPRGLYSARSCGFTAGWQRDGDEFAALAEAWRQKIRARLAPGGRADE